MPRTGISVKSPYKMGFVSPILNDSAYSRVDAVLESISLGGIPLPGWLLGKAHRQTLWTYPIPDFPGRLLIHQVTIQNGQILIS